MVSTWRPSQCLFGGSPCTLAACLPVGKDEQKGRERKRMMRRWREGQIQISLASVWQWMWEMNCLIGTFVSIRRRSSVSAMTEGAPKRSSASGLPPSDFITWTDPEGHLLQLCTTASYTLTHTAMTFAEDASALPGQGCTWSSNMGGQEGQHCSYIDNQILFRNKTSTVLWTSNEWLFWSIISEFRTSFSKNPTSYPQNLTLISEFDLQFLYTVKILFLYTELWDICPFELFLTTFNKIKHNIIVKVMLLYSSN